MKIANQQSESDEPLSTCGNGERGNRTLLHSPGCHSCRIADFPIGGRSSALVPLVLAAILGVFLMSFSGSAQQNFFNFSVQYGGIRFKFQTNADQYYVLEDSQDLRNFTSDMIALGKFGPLFEVPATNSQQFFQAESISIYSPQSTLNDGIDDVFKLDNGLNPLDPTLANSLSGFLGGGGINLTWLQYYSLVYGRATSDGQFYGREVSVFNQGSPSAYASREVSVFNFGQAFGRADAISHEISVYNGQSPPLVAAPQEVYSREVSAFNFGQGFGSADAISREVSVYNGQSPPLVAVPQQVYSREVSAFNFGQGFGSADAISREVSVYNNVQD